MSVKDIRSPIISGGILSKPYLALRYLALCFFRGFFSSPAPKSQVSFSDQNLSDVGRCRRCCWRKLVTFSSSSPESLGQCQPNLAQSILE